MNANVLAHEIYQDHLNVVSDHVLAGRIDECMPHFAPCILSHTARGIRFFDSPSALWEDTQLQSEMLRKRGTTRFIRLVKAGRYLGEGRIEGWHETHVLCGATALMPAFRSRMVLEHGSNGWAVSQAEHEIAKSTEPRYTAKAEPGLFRDSWSMALRETEPKLENAQPVYQAFLDALSDQQNLNEFAKFSAFFLFPYRAYVESQVIDLARPEDIREYFDNTIVNLRSSRSKVIRVSDKAQFLEPDLIVGYHKACIVNKKKGPFVGPIHSRMVLCFRDGAWRCVSVANTLSEDTALFDRIDLATVMKRVRKTLGRAAL